SEAFGFPARRRHVDIHLFVAVISQFRGCACAEDRARRGHTDHCRNAAAERCFGLERSPAKASTRLWCQLCPAPDESTPNPGSFSYSRLDSRLLKRRKLKSEAMKRCLKGESVSFAAPGDHCIGAIGRYLD